MSNSQKIYDISPDKVKVNNGTHGIIFSKIKNNSHVLDVGCATGTLGEALHKEKNCTVVGIDYSEKSIEIARQKNSYEKLLQVNLDNYSGELDGYSNYFDCIVLADVLEHLKNPSDLITEFKKLLKPDGVFLISLPNTAHGSIKLKLLKNRFEYTDSGLLDNTHIVFFTLENIIKFSNGLNLEIMDLGRVYLDIEETEQSINLNEYPLYLKNYVSNDLESFVYQYVIETKVSDGINLSDINKKYMTATKEEIKRLKKYLVARRGNLKRRIFRSAEKLFKKLYLAIKGDHNVI